MSKQKRKSNFMTGAFVLMLGGVIVKIIGALFKVPLGNLVSGDAMAYFNNAYDIYTWMYIITTAGLPVALSRMVSEDNTLGRYTQAKKTLRIAFTGFMLFGLAGTSLIMVFAKQLAGAMGSPESYCAILAIAPAILFEVIMSSYRGYFQGNQNMVPTAISQIIVAVCKMVVGYSLALWLSRRGYSMAIVAAGAIFGVTAGTVVGAIYLFIKRLLFRPVYDSTSEIKDTQSTGTIAKKLLMIAIPITIGSSVLSVTNLMDAAVVQRRLADIASTLPYSVSMIYGSYSGYARVLFNLPTALIIPMGTGIIPSIAASFIKRDKEGTKSIISSTFRIAVFLALPSGVGIAVLARPILQLLYSSKVTEVSIAAPLLTRLGPAVVFVCLVSITNAILQAIGKEWMPVLTMVAGGSIKLLLNYVMVGNPSINIKGAPISTSICYAVITILNIIIIVKTLGKGVDVAGAFVKPLFAAGLCGVTAHFGYKLANAVVGGNIATLAAIAAAAIVYFAILGFTKWYKKEDIILLPKGEKIEKVLAKLGWMG